MGPNHPSDNVLIDSILWTGFAWEDHTLRYAFIDGPTEVRTWTEVEKSAFRGALASWAAVADLTFLEVTDPAEADLREKVTDLAGIERKTHADSVLAPTARRNRRMPTPRATPKAGSITKATAGLPKDSIGRRRGWLLGDMALRPMSTSLDTLSGWRIRITRAAPRR